MKKLVTFCKLKTSLSRNFKYILTILLQIQREYNFLPTRVNADKPKFVAFLVIACTTAPFFAQISSSENVSKRDAILAPVATQ